MPVVVQHARATSGGRRSDQIVRRRDTSLASQLVRGNPQSQNAASGTKTEPGTTSLRISWSQSLGKPGDGPLRRFRI